MSLLECDNDYVTELHAYDFIIKGFVIKKGGGGVICARPCI